jgi:hypothetical protein
VELHAAQDQEQKQGITYSCLDFRRDYEFRDGSDDNRINQINSYMKLRAKVYKHSSSPTAARKTCNRYRWQYISRS